MDDIFIYVNETFKMSDGLIIWSIAFLYTILPPSHHNVHNVHKVPQHLIDHQKKII